MTPAGTILEKLGVGQPSFSTAVRTSDYEVEYPFPTDNPSAKIIRARFWQRRTAYVPPVSNSTLGPAYPGAYYAGDVNFRDLTMGMMEFTRTWATIPADRVDFEQLAIQYPGFDSLTVTARDPRQRTVMAKLELAFFLVGIGGAYETPDKIPVLSATLPDVNYLTDDTTPTASTYFGYITADNTSADSYSLVATDTELTRYAGNIWQRVNRKLKAR